MIAPLVAFAPLSERMEGIRGHFAGGGRWSGVIVVFAALAGCLLVLAVVQHVRDTVKRREPDHPGRFFRTLLGGLGLTVRQRRILQRMATDLRLEHPAVVLLSRELFREQAAAWDKMARNIPTRELVAIEQRVFQSAPTAKEVP